MTRVKTLFASLLTAAIATVPAATAQTVHVVGVGSSAQFLGSMIGASFLASANLASGKCIYHWTLKNGLNAHDNRDSLNRIIDETGSVGILWDANCSDSTGATGISDVWIIGQYDSTLGVRLFSAQQKAPTAGPGATVYLNGVTGGEASGNLVSPNNLWADNKADVNIPAGMVTFIGTAAPGTYHVNLGLTDIRPEDALYATTRAKAALNTTSWAGLGYVGPTGQIGAPIYTAQSGSTSNFTPIGFGLAGAKDPINTAATVPDYTTIPVGAAPIVFAYNNGGSFSTSVANLSSGVKGDGTADAGKYAAANLFDGTTNCSTDSKAFGGPGDGSGTAVTLFLREPLSGTMNTTEFNVFRTTGNTTDSQEKGLVNPTRAPYNPLNLACNGKGSRQRRIGTGQILTAINGTPNGLGYFFFSFANAATVNGTAANASNFNYLTLDGVDPIGLPGTSNQELPFCSGVLCPASQWTGSVSFPNLRNGTYKAWSLYRWTVYTPDNDSQGPSALAQFMQDNIDTTVTDFVPFITTSNTDGLEVYRSHFTQSTKTGNNGPASPTEALTGGNSLGGGTEAGGDEGGVIYGHDWAVVNTANIATGACAHNTKVTKVANLFVNGQNSRNFGFSGANATHAAGQPLLLEGTTVTINGNPATVLSCIAPTAGVLYVNGSLGTQTHVSMESYIAPAAPGELNKKQ